VKLGKKQDNYIQSKGISFLEQCMVVNMNKVVFQILQDSVA